MKQKFQEYYLGLDIGTNSVGWAVTDLNYKVLRFNKKSMWGARLFKEASTAEDRRKHRSARRRLKRRKQRIKLLQELFAEEISKVDQGFFLRLEESKYHYDDRKQGNKYTLFDGKDYSDKDFHKNYPTIFHLRKAFIDNDNIKDIRLLYLALHNIIKKRGHFIFEGQDFSEIKNIDTIFDSLRVYLLEEMNLDLDLEITNDAVEGVLKDKSLSKKDKIKNLMDLFNSKDKRLKQIFTAIVGNKANFKEMFDNEKYYSKDDTYKIKFSEIIYEEKREEYEAFLDNDIELIDILKKIYDWTVLDRILEGETYLSNRMVSIYEEHKRDLKELKYILKKYDFDKYNEFFKSKNSESNYSAYINHEYTDKKKNSKVLKNVKNANIQNISKKIQSILENIESEIENDDMKIFQRLLFRAKEEIIIPKQRVKTNGVIPYQVHKNELLKILENAEQNFEFLKIKDENNMTVKEKIIKLLEFRIPYYVGPLNNYHHKNNGGFAWAVRKDTGKITPWNFEQKIDKNASAEEFIKSMTNKCTYLIGEDVIPKDSLTYLEFVALNEINNIKLDGKSINISLKKDMFDTLLREEKQVTLRKLRDFLRIKGIAAANTIEITGIDNGIKSSLSTHINFKNKFNFNVDNRKDREIIDKVILWKCLYGEDKNIFNKKITEVYGDLLDDKIIKDLSKLKYSGWGKLSYKFLREIQGDDTETGEHFDNLIEALYETNYNLQELLSEKFTFIKNIEIENNKNQEHQESYLDIIDNMNLPVNLKRSVNQTIKILEEIKKITGREPKKVFIEMARGGDINEKGKTKDSRKEDLLALYKNIKNEEKLYEELFDQENSNLRSKKLFLYFKQMGRCMYSDEIIDINKLMDNNIYDIDHIYPRSKVKDDSFDNLVLVNKKENQYKSDDYPISPEIQFKMIKRWKLLLDKKLISTKKFNRLVRKDEFTDSELAGFIARQLVETRQSSKAIGQIIPKIFPSTDVVYTKASNTAELRKYLKFIKVREMNNFHHAHDAYLTIVAGNVHDVKFTKSPLNYIKNYRKNKKKYEYSLRRIYDFDIKNSNTVAWDINRTKKEVLKQLDKNDVNITEMTYIEKGKLFDETIQRKSKEKKSINEPLKKDMKDTSKYGSYTKISGAYFFIVEHIKKIKKLNLLKWYRFI